MNRNVLIIDDNVQFTDSLSTMLSGDEFSVFTAVDSKDAFKILKQQNIDFILLDVRLGEESGIEVLVRCREAFPMIPVIMLTGYASIESAVNSIKLGAFDYIQKPVKYERLLRVLKNAETITVLEYENRILSERFEELVPKIISNDSRIFELMDTIKRLSETNIPILLSGENGVGKEIFADYIHAQSQRKHLGFLKFNCASFPENLLDNELFGHDKGAFTGANSLYKGVFERADKGTLFLDEIGDMALNVQAKVLRVLQNRELFRLGGNKLIKVDIKLISATNKKLEDQIAAGLFREDLYYRLNAANIIIPPLRERKSDIPLLVEHFLKMNNKENCKNIQGISPGCLKLLIEHDWPGNIRELRNIINYSAAVCTNSEIDVNDLPVGFSGKITVETSKNLLHLSERNMIIKELERFGFNKKKAAEALNISRSTLYSKLRKHKIEI